MDGVGGLSRSSPSDVPATMATVPEGGVLSNEQDESLPAVQSQS